MGDYLKLFETHAEYQTYEQSGDMLKPNVSYCEDNNCVHYNPLVPPQPIAPVGKVQVFANPQCTEYADGQSNTVWVRLNQDFGIDDGTTWGTMGLTGTYLGVYTPPIDPYSIALWVDFTEVDRDGTQPFERGEIVECSMPIQYFTPINNPQVIFE